MVKKEAIEKSEVETKETPMEKLVVRRKRRKVAKRVARKKPGPKKGVTRKRRTKKKVATVAKRGPGRPPKKRGTGRPPVKRVGARRAAGTSTKRKAIRRPGRPAKKVAVRRAAPEKNQIELPINPQTDIDFWSNMVRFLNGNRGDGFAFILDGKSFSLGAK